MFQLTGPENWKDAMTALGFHDGMKAAGFENLGVIIDNDDKRNELLALLDELFATGTRDDWVARLRGADIVSAPINTMLEASNDPDVLANGYVTEIDYPKHGKRLKVHGTPWQFSETPAKPGIAPELGEHNDAVLAELGYSAADWRICGRGRSSEPVHPPPDTSELSNERDCPIRKVHCENRDENRLEQIGMSLE